MASVAARRLRGPSQEGQGGGGEQGAARMGGALGGGAGCVPREAGQGERELVVGAGLLGALDQQGQGEAEGQVVAATAGRGGGGAGAVAAEACPSVIPEAALLVASGSSLTNRTRISATPSSGSSHRKIGVRASV